MSKNDVQMGCSARRVAYQLNVTLDDDHAEMLRRVAELAEVDEATAARSILSTVLDESDPADEEMGALLDRIPGAWERAQQGLADLRAGRVTELDDL